MIIESLFCSRKRELQRKRRVDEEEQANIFKFSLDRRIASTGCGKLLAIVPSGRMREQVNV